MLDHPETILTPSSLVASLLRSIERPASLDRGYPSNARVPWTPFPWTLSNLRASIGLLLYTGRYHDERRFTLQIVFLFQPDRTQLRDFL
jgi:hypothetical protein